MNYLSVALKAGRSSAIYLAFFFLFFFLVNLKKNHDLCPQLCYLLLLKMMQLVKFF